MASGYLLDSCAIIAAIKGEPLSLLNKLATLPPSRLLFSEIVRAELLFGAEKAQQSAQSRATLDVIISGFDPLPFNADDAFAYACIRAALERKGANIRPMDLLIAAQATARGLVLVTDNLREFRRVPGLKCENWMR